MERIGQSADEAMAASMATNQPSERTFTAAEMRTEAASYQQRADDLQPHLQHDIEGYEATAAMLRQAADADSRWEQLKAWAMLHNQEGLVIEMTHLERKAARIEGTRA